MRDREPGAHGLTLLPFVAGERAPNWNDAARAVLQGFTLATTAVDIYHAALEGIAARFAMIGRRVRDYLGAAAPRALVASGGALTDSPAWLQIMADCQGLPDPRGGGSRAHQPGRGAAGVELARTSSPRRRTCRRPSAGPMCRMQSGPCAIGSYWTEHVALYERLYST